MGAALSRGVLIWSGLALMGLGVAALTGVACAEESRPEGAAPPEGFRTVVRGAGARLTVDETALRLMPLGTADDALALSPGWGIRLDEASSVRAAGYFELEVEPGGGEHERLGAVELV